MYISTIYKLSYSPQSYNRKCQSFHCFIVMGEEVSFSTLLYIFFLLLFFLFVFLQPHSICIPLYRCVSLMCVIATLLYILMSFDQTVITYYFISYWSINFGLHSLIRTTSNVSSLVSRRHNIFFIMDILSLKIFVKKREDDIF